ncbi:hypothetical protein FPANT_3250 [Fusarium pseudoanthophilum]|uniref:Uncharacterized protein n=1 Tax=Fusarium pseudoanthophilum TaxID=48495 RepID=A0A8H5PN75_9HYPO|nr:hypothetical protein FPANT_3250 [Fusarium pseudoanthophilum]
MSTTGHRSNGSSSTCTIVFGLLSPPPTPPPLNSGFPPPPSQPPYTPPDNGTGNCIETLVMAQEIEEQEQDKDTTKTIPPPPEPTVGFGSAVKAIFRSLKARLRDLQAIAQNQTSRAFQFFSK